MAYPEDLTNLRQRCHNDGITLACITIKSAAAFADIKQPHVYHNHTRFVENHYDGLSAAEKESFDKLLEIEDPEILGFMLYNDHPSDAGVANIVEKIRTAL